MATHYIDEIRTLQPQGPYFLAGLSFGGMVAYEMAQQLHSQGQSVGLVGLLDTDYEGRLEQLSAWQALIRRLYLIQQRLGIHIQEIRSLRRSDLRAYLRGKGLILESRLKDRIWAGAYRLHEVSGTSLSKFLQDVREANRLASRRYRPRVYAGCVTLFRAAPPASDAPKWHPWTAWRHLAAGGMTVHYVPGDHLTMLREPHVRVLAEKVRACISEVIERASS
jgi:aspartate racemase